MVTMSMSIAVNEQKQIVNVKQVERGLACMCFCFECDEPVVARKGEKNEHHFAHLNNKESCTIHPESILHKFAKQVIMEKRRAKYEAAADIIINTDGKSLIEVCEELVQQLLAMDENK